MSMESGMESGVETVDVEVVIGDFFTKPVYSPYGVITSVNAVLKALGVDKVLPGPMGYTYCKKGYIATVEGSDKKKVTREAAIEWCEKYVGRLAARMVMESDAEVTESE